MTCPVNVFPFAPYVPIDRFAPPRRQFCVIQGVARRPCSPVSALVDGLRLLVARVRRPCRGAVAVRAVACTVSTDWRAYLCTITRWLTRVPGSGRLFYAAGSLRYEWTSCGCQPPTAGHRRPGPRVQHPDRHGTTIAAPGRKPHPGRGHCPKTAISPRTTRTSGRNGRCATPVTVDPRNAVDRRRPRDRHFAAPYATCPTRRRLDPETVLDPGSRIAEIAPLDRASSLRSRTRPTPPVPDPSDREERRDLPCRTATRSGHRGWKPPVPPTPASTNRGKAEAVRTRCEFCHSYGSNNAAQCCKAGHPT